MTRSDAPPRADLTFIVGNPRSRQNLSRIRAHASRATRKNHDDLDVPSTSAVATPPLPASCTYITPHDIDTNEKPAHELPAPATHHRPWTPEPLAASPNPTGQSEDSTSIRGSSRDSPAALTSDGLANPHDLLPRPATRHFSTQGSTIGTWWERYPEARSSGLGFHSFDPHKRSRLTEEEEDESDSRLHPLNAGARDPQSAISPTRDALLLDLPSSTRSGTPNGTPRSHTTDEHPQSKKQKHAAKKIKSKKTAQKKMQTRWRVATGPSKAVVLAPNHTLTQFEFVLRQTTDFYDHSFSTIWEPLLREDPKVFEGQSDFELFDESMLSAAALIEAGQVGKAAHVIQCIVEMLVHLMHQSHPEAYYMFLILSLQTSSTAIAQLRTQLRAHLLPVAERVLGQQHPITKVLRLQIPKAAQGQLQTAVLRSIRDFHHRRFGEDSFQTLSIDFHCARAASDLGNTEDALSNITAAIRQAEHLQGMNALCSVFLNIEKAAMYMEASPPNISILPELHLSDVIRRLQVITQQLAKLPEDSVEAQKLEVAVVHAKIVSLRMLGRLHGLRKNYGAAVQVYTQVLEYAVMMLGPDAVPVHLAQADLDAIKIEQLKDSMKSVSLASVDGKDVPQPSRSKYHVAKTAVGSIATMNRTYIGEGSDEIPNFTRMVVGFTVVGMPTMCHTPEAARALN